MVPPFCSSVLVQNLYLVYGRMLASARPGRSNALMASLCSVECLWCYENRKGRASHRGHWGYRPPRRREGLECMGLIKRETPGTNGSNLSPERSVDEADRILIPTLLDFLFMRAWPDGTARVPGTLLLFADGERLKACLSDRDQGLVLFLTAESTSELFSLAETLLSDPRADWRPARSAQPARPKK